ncbi:hypothetical protein FKP32DRAFT_984524 [Trametes sanguinea]|nr:hypothetical protein FKP32DRAFT_984524 [Trametes sanguinea]
MFTALITFFLTVLGALRATPLYTGILTLGNGFTVKSWFRYEVSVPLLDNKTATAATYATGIGSHTQALLFRWPLLPYISAPPLVLTLPPGFSDHALIVRPEYSVSEAPAQDEALDAILGLFGLVVTIYWLVILLLRLRPGTSDDTVDDLFDNALDNAYASFGKPYDGTDYQKADLLENVSTTEPVSVPLGMPEESQPPRVGALSSRRTKSKKVKSKAILSSSSTPEVAMASTESTEVLAPFETESEPVEAAVDTTPLGNSETGAEATLPAVTEPDALVEQPSVETVSNRSGLEEDDGGAWMIWSNRRRRQHPRPPPPRSTIALNATRSRLSSIASDSRSIDSLFSSAPSTLTTPTSAASSSRRSSIAFASPSKPHPTPSGFRYRITIQTRTRMRTLTSTFDKPSDNKYSVLEAFEAEG